VTSTRPTTKAMAVQNESTFSQGTSLVQISDVSRMFIECTVDEADIATVVQGQAVHIVVEAYPGKVLDGNVIKIYPAAVTANSVTTVKARVELTGLDKVDLTRTPLRPGMNATCDFIQASIADTVTVPSQAVQKDKQGSFVLVKKEGASTPEHRVVELGQKGNDSIEILSGLKEGEQIVITTIDLADMRQRQQKIQQQTQGSVGLGSTSARPPGGGR